jgi:hypothetical protein
MVYPNAKAREVEETSSDIPCAPQSATRYSVGDRLLLTVYERFGNYLPTEFVARVVKVKSREDGSTSEIKVRWHLPQSLGYDTRKGCVSWLLHVTSGVWLEKKKRPKAVLVTISKINVDRFYELLDKAANT